MQAQRANESKKLPSAAAQSVLGCEEIIRTGRHWVHAAAASPVLLQLVRAQARRAAFRRDGGIPSCSRQEPDESWRCSYTEERQFQASELITRP
jgi:hypothetical protein